MWFKTSFPFYGTKKVHLDSTEASYLTKLCHFAPPPLKGGGAKWQSFVLKKSLHPSNAFNAQFGERTFSLRKCMSCTMFLLDGCREGWMRQMWGPSWQVESPLRFCNGKSFVENMIIIRMCISYDGLIFASSSFFALSDIRMYGGTSTTDWAG